MTKPDIVELKCGWGGIYDMFIGDIFFLEFYFVFESGDIESAGFQFNQHAIGELKQTMYKLQSRSIKSTSKKGS